MHCPTITSVQDAVLSYDLATLESLVSHLLDDSAIIYIRVANNNQVLAQGGDKTVLEQKRTPDINFDQVDDGIFDVVAPIEGAGFRYGTVSLGISTGNIEQIIRTKVIKKYVRKNQTVRVIEQIR